MTSKSAASATKQPSSPSSADEPTKVVHMQYANSLLDAIFGSGIPTPRQYSGSVRDGLFFSARTSASRYLQQKNDVKDRSVSLPDRPFAENLQPAHHYIILAPFDDTIAMYPDMKQQKNMNCIEKRAICEKPLSLDFIESHILKVPRSLWSVDPKTTWRYTCFNGRTVIIKGKTIMTHKGFSGANSAEVLCDDLIFHKSSKTPYLVFHISKPLCDCDGQDSEISTSETAQPTSSRSLKKEKVTQRAVVFGRMEDMFDACPQIRDEVSVKFEILINEFNGKQSECQIFSEAELKSEIDTLLISAIEIFNGLSENARQALLELNVDSSTLTRIIESYVMHRVYDMTFYRISHCSVEEDKKFSDVLVSLRGLNKYQVGLPQQIPDIEERLKNASLLFADIGSKRTPQERFDILSGTMHALLGPLIQEEKMNVEEKSNILGGDYLLPLLILVVIRSNVPNFLSNLIFMKAGYGNYGFGEYEYMVSSLEAVYIYLKKKSEPLAQLSQYNTKMKIAVDDRSSSGIIDCISEIRKIENLPSFFQSTQDVLDSVLFGIDDYQQSLTAGKIKDVMPTLMSYYSDEFLEHQRTPDGSTLLAFGLKSGIHTLISDIADVIEKRPRSVRYVQLNALDNDGQSAAHYLYKYPKLISRIRDDIHWEQNNRDDDTVLTALAQHLDGSTNLSAHLISVLEFLCSKQSRSDNKSKRASNVKRDAKSTGTPTKEKSVLLTTHRNANGDTLLHLISAKKVLKAVCKFFPTTEVQNDNGETPLHVHIKKHNFACASYLAHEHKGAFMMRDSMGNTPLHALLMLHNLPQKGLCLLSLLISRSDVNVRNLKGQTALHLASVNGNKIIVKKLLDADADPDIVDASGIRPIDYVEVDEVRTILNRHMLSKCREHNGVKLMIGQAIISPRSDILYQLSTLQNGCEHTVLRSFPDFATLKECLAVEKLGTLLPSFSIHLPHPCSIPSCQSLSVLNLIKSILLTFMEAITENKETLNSVAVQKFLFSPDWRHGDQKKLSQKLLQKRLQQCIIDVPGTRAILEYAAFFDRSQSFILQLEELQEKIIILQRSRDDAMLQEKLLQSKALQNGLKVANDFENELAFEGETAPYGRPISADEFIGAKAQSQIDDGGRQAMRLRTPIADYEQAVVEMCTAFVNGRADRGCGSLTTLFLRNQSLTSGMKSTISVPLFLIDVARRTEQEIAVTERVPEGDGSERWSFFNKLFKRSHTERNISNDTVSSVGNTKSTEQSDTINRTEPDESNHETPAETPAGHFKQEEHQSATSSRTTRAVVDNAATANTSTDAASETDRTETTVETVIASSSSTGPDSLGQSRSLKSRFRSFTGGSVSSSGADGSFYEQFTQMPSELSPRARLERLKSQLHFFEDKVATEISSFYERRRSTTRLMLRCCIREQLVSEKRRLQELVEARDKLMRASLR